MKDDCEKFPDIKYSLKNLSFDGSQTDGMNTFD